jgi:hypothetical protein
VFAAASLCICATTILHIPFFYAGSGEWARLNYLFIPILQLAGVTALALTLAALRLMKR